MSLFRTVVTACAAIATQTFLAVGVLAQPANTNITFTSPHCNGYILAKTGANSYTLTCVFTSCVMTATPPIQVPGQPVTITAACTPVPTSVLWTASIGCTTPRPGNSLTTATVTETSDRICGYYANVSDGTLGGQGSVPVTWSSAPPPTPTNCSITKTPANGQLPTAGGPVTLAGACTGSVTSWAWKKNGTAWQTGANQTDTLPANTGSAALTTTYELTACNGVSCAAPITTTFLVAGSAPVGFCAQYSQVKFVELNWGNPPVDTYGGVGLNSGDVIVGRLTVPAGATSPGDSPGVISIVEHVGQPAERIMTLSTQPCDFRGWIPNFNFPAGDPSGANAPLAWAGGINPSRQYLLAGDPVGFPAKPLLTPGAVYYVNLQTILFSTGGNSCTSFTCDVRITVNTPN